MIGALLAGAMMFSCNEPVEEITFGTEISVSVTELAQFAKENAEAQTLEVTANGDWMAVAPAWLEISPRYGVAGTTTVSVKAADNYEKVLNEAGEVVEELGPQRSATIQFVGEKEAVAEVAVKQEGDPNKWDPAVPRPVTMQYFNEVAETGDGFTYVLTGKITEVVNTQYGNFYFEDETGTAYVYGLVTPDGKTQTQWAAAGLKVNDVITVMGARNEYGGSPQMTNAVYVSHEVGEASPIVDATIADFLAAEKSGIQYRISGVVTSIAKAEYGNIYIKDATGEVYVYGIGAKGEFETLGVEVGDIVTLISNRGEYNGTPQAANSVVEKKIDVTAVDNIAALLATEESKSVYYMISGTVSGMDAAGAYGNIYLNDETGSIYVYGVLAGWNGTKGAFADLVAATGLKDGDTLTIIGCHSSYNGTKQIVNALYYSHVAGEGGETPEPEQPAEKTYVTVADLLASTEAMAENTYVKVMVVSNSTLNTLTSMKNIHLQDATAGLGARFTANHSFAFGDELEINVSGMVVTEYNGAKQLNNVPNDKAVVLSQNNTIEAKTVSMADYLANKYESQYIALEGVQVVEADLAKTWAVSDQSAHTSVTLEDAEGNTFVAFSSKYAATLAKTVGQGSGTIKGISSINNGTMQIIFAQESDVDGLTGERF